ncbi:ParA family protein [Nostoc favosum]|uniref:AAA family ATPase n=1 Tax=Nostoc favosum CHAB5714 TaxID=2780399 RepID=A0ABS8IA23_9NOSO|nr:AAA family ATPase [Nostoc favosum]MCC5600986.1 AAA family ATPase [Nostoc favosum CHAB5714]
MLFNPELCRNESEVESKLIVQYLLPQLGYTPDTWHQEVAVGSIRLDFLAFAAQVIPFVLDANSPLSVVMEAKHPKQNLNHHVLRLRHYLTSLNVRYGLLTNGKEIKIYQKLQTDIQLVFQCSGKDVETKLENIKGLIGRESLKEGQLVNKTEVKITENVLNLQTKRQHSMKTIAIYHNKGGVGKTTVTVNLAAALRKKGKRVLIIDIDSQANTTLATGLIRFDDEELDDLKDCNISNVLLSEDSFPIKEVARTSLFSQPEIDVVPSHINLMKYEYELSQQPDSKMMLILKLNVIENNYDIVIIDTPPAIDLFSEIALITADYLLIPSDLKPFANQGLLNVKEFIKRIDKVRKYISKAPIEILGVLPCKISTNAKFIQSTLPKRIEQITKRYGLNVMDSVIYEREDLAKCGEQVKIIGNMEIPDPRSVLDFKPNSTSAQEMELLAIEVLQKIGMP